MLFSEPALWQSLRLAGGSLAALPEQQRAEWLSVKRSLLQRIARLLSKLEINEGHVIIQLGPEGGEQLADLLQVLAPGQLAELVLHCNPGLPPAVLQVLPRLRHLATLQLHSWKLVPEAAAGLCRLPCLRSLSCSAKELTDGHLSYITQLPLLTHLELVSTERPLPAGVLQLTRLKKLRSLSLYEHDIHPGVLVVPAPAAFAAGGLERFDFNPGGVVQVGRGACGCAGARLG